MICTYKSGRNTQEDNHKHGNPYKGIMCFMIVGLKENVPVVAKDIPETGVTETR